LFPDTACVRRTGVHNPNSWRVPETDADAREFRARPASRRVADPVPVEFRLRFAATLPCDDLPVFRTPVI